MARCPAARCCSGTWVPRTWSRPSTTSPSSTSPRWLARPVTDAWERFVDAHGNELLGNQPVEVIDPGSGANLIAFQSGWGDGYYPTWIGRTAGGQVACFVADILVLQDATLLP